MPYKCCVVGCVSKSGLDIPNLSFHQIPRNEKRRQIWLDAIGKENLITNLKSIVICSLHFEDSSFNRTLNLVRLRDDAVPISKRAHTHPSTSMDSTLLLAIPLLPVHSSLAHIKPSTSSSVDTTLPLESSPLHVHPTLAHVHPTKTMESTSPLVSSLLPVNPTLAHVHPSTSMNTAMPSVSQLLPVHSSLAHMHPSTSVDTTSPLECPPFPVDPTLTAIFINKINELEKKVQGQKRKIKCLNETVRRKNIKIASYQDIIKELKEKIS